MVFWTLGCLQKSGAAGKECKGEEVLKGRWEPDDGKVHKLHQNYIPPPLPPQWQLYARHHTHTHTNHTRVKTVCAVYFYVFFVLFLNSKEEEICENGWCTIAVACPLADEVSRVGGCRAVGKLPQYFLLFNFSRLQCTAGFGTYHQHQCGRWA